MARRKQTTPAARRRQDASRGGKARAAKLSPEERRAIARHAVQVRWGKVERREKPRLGPQEIGDVLLEPGDGQMRLTLTEQHWTTLGVEGAEAVIRWMRQWVREEKQRHVSHTLSLEDSDNCIESEGANNS